MRTESGVRQRNSEWSDDELGMVQETLSRPAQEVADMLGCSRSSVYGLRSRIRKGWTRKKRELWTSDEDDFIRANVTNRTVRSIAMDLGRTERATYRRMGAIGIRVGRGHGDLDPFFIVDRRVVAKTCLTCGLLLPGEWFRKTKKNGTHGWHSSCRKCLSRKTIERQKGLDRGYDPARRRRQLQRMKDLTEPLATRGRMEYTTTDHEVMRDPDLTVLQKALRLKRTYSAISTQAHRNGYRSKSAVLLSCAEAASWSIDNPNLSRVDQITAALKQEFADAGIQFPEWDWDD